MSSTHPMALTTPLLSRSRSILHLLPDPRPRSISVTSRKFLKNIPIILSVFFAVFILVKWSSALFEGPIPTGPPWHGPPFLLPVSISKLMGPYSPWWPVEEYEKPPGCDITQVHFLQRHGSRFPTKGQDRDIKRALSRISPPDQERKNNTLSFMRRYKYGLKQNELIWFGATEAWAAGVQAYNRYPHLAHQTPPFLRVANSSRVVETSKFWRKGFQLAGRISLMKPLIVSEEPGMNNTLKNNQCPNHSEKPADLAQELYLQEFAPPIVARLNDQAPGSTLQIEDILPLMSLCSFESLYKYKTSPWCSVFRSGQWDGDVGDGSGGEWEGFEYLKDLEKFYNTGPGNFYGRPQGIGWINELIARLTNNPVNDTTQTNHTVVTNNATFPLNRTMYADFTHDNEMIAIFAAMGIFRQPSTASTGQKGKLQMLMEDGRVWKGEMDPRNPDPDRVWIASKLVPFAARMVVERLSCPAPQPQLKHSSHSKREEPPSVEAVRVLVNDAVVRVPGCGGVLEGICTMEEFLESQAYARNQGEGEWEKCFEVEP